MLSLINRENIEATPVNPSSSPMYRVSLVRLNYTSVSFQGSSNAFICSDYRLIVPPTSIEALRSKLEAIDVRAAEKQAVQDKKNASNLIRTFVNALREKKSSNRASVTDNGQNISTTHDSNHSDKRKEGGDASASERVDASAHDSIKKNL